MEKYEFFLNFSKRLHCFKVRENCFILCNPFHERKREKKYKIYLEKYELPDLVESLLPLARLLNQPIVVLAREFVTLLLL